MVYAGFMVLVNIERGRKFGRSCPVYMGYVIQNGVWRVGMDLNVVRFIGEKSKAEEG